MAGRRGVDNNQVTGCIVFRIRGNGFLQYMVRTITGTLLEIGQERIRPEGVLDIFAARDRRLAGPSVPAHGLHLINVEY